MHAAVLRTELAGLKAEFEAYLRTSEARPNVSESLLRSYVAADLLVEAVQPSRPPHAGFADEFGIPEEAFGPQSPRLKFEGSEGWDFYPWMHEKVTRIKRSTQRLYELWSLDPRSLKLKLDAPMSPREWIRGGIASALGDLEHNASKVFDVLFADAVTVAQENQLESLQKRTADEPWSIPFLIPPDAPQIATIKIGLPSAPWTESEQDWRLGAFPEARDQIAVALSGESSTLRIINVHHTHGAEVIVEHGSVAALLWRKWNPPAWDAGDRGFRRPDTTTIERAIAAWAISRPGLVLLTDIGTLVIAVTLKLEVAVESFSELMRTLIAANSELDILSESEREQYVVEFNALLEHMSQTD